MENLKQKVLEKYKGKEYRIFLLAWDIANNDIFHIEDAIRKEKITIEEYKKVAKDFLDAGAIKYIREVLI